MMEEILETGSGAGKRATVTKGASSELRGSTGRHDNRRRVRL